MSTSIVSRSTPVHLRDVLNALALHTEMHKRQRQDLCSGVRAFCKVAGREPREIAADPSGLRVLAKQLYPAGLSSGHWRNTQSRLSKALQLVGSVTAPRRSKQPMSPAWQALSDGFACRYERFKLSRLARHCSAEGIDPDGVDDLTIAELDRVLGQSLVPRPKQVLRDTVLVWNRGVAGVPGWPSRVLTVPSKRPDYSLPLDQFSPAYATDVQAFLERLQHVDIFDEDGGAPLAPSPSENRKLQLRQMATALVLSGRDLETIGSLRDLTGLTAARTILQHFHTRNGERKTGQLENFALLILQIGKYWVKLPQAEVEQLQKLRKRVSPGQAGMTSRNRARLRPFEDLVNVQRLLSVPALTMSAISKAAPPSLKDAVRVQSALGVALLLYAPIRAKNLASLQVGRHIIRTRSAASSPSHLVIPAGEVKNAQALEFILPPETVTLLQLYTRSFLPLLDPTGSGFLFPNTKGGSKLPGALGVQLREHVQKISGLTINAHLFCHLAAMLYLQAVPGDYESVRLLLGHKSLDTTIKSYCDFKQTDAVRRFDAILNALKGRKEGA